MNAERTPPEERPHRSNVTYDSSPPLALDTTMEGRLRLLRIASRMRLRGYERLAVNLEATAAGDLPTLMPMGDIGEAPYPASGADR